jgi:hypothetical protein
MTMRPFYVAEPLHIVLLAEPILIQPSQSEGLLRPDAISEEARSWREWFLITDI